jgi:hypothetical protein
MMSKKAIFVALALTGSLAGCTAKLDPADLQKIEAAVSRAERRPTRPTSRHAARPTQRSARKRQRRSAKPSR